MITAKEARNKMTLSGDSELERYLSFLDREISCAAGNNCPGVALLTPKHLAADAIFRLKVNGFTVELMEENELHITWV